MLVGNARTVIGPIFSLRQPENIPRTVRHWGLNILGWSIGNVVPSVSRKETDREKDEKGMPDSINYS